MIRTILDLRSFVLGGSRTDGLDCGRCRRRVGHHVAAIGCSGQSTTLDRNVAWRNQLQSKSLLQHTCESGM